MKPTVHRKLVRPAVLAVAFFLALPSVTALATDLDDILYGIAMVETRNRDVGLHDDGVSYGRYGITNQAVRELQRVGHLEQGRYNLIDPDTNRQIAILYLRHLKDRYGSWWKATEMYNPRGQNYARKVWAAIDRRRMNREA